MTQTIKKYLNDSFAARWTALVLVASMMFFAYMFVDVLSPLSTLLETSKGWTAENYGTFCSSEYFLNVFAFFLIFAGIILDKMGIRFTGVLSGAVMVIGASFTTPHSQTEVSLPSLVQVGRNAVMGFSKTWV